MLNIESKWICFQEIELSDTSFALPNKYVSAELGCAMHHRRLSKTSTYSALTTKKGNIDLTL